MVKRISLLRRFDGLSHEQFRTHLLETHAGIARRAANLRGYRVNLPRNPEAAFGWDAVVESWFDSEETSVWEERIGAELMADRDQFVGLAESFFVDEHMVIQPGR
jgi:hypothetical protein